MVSVPLLVLKKHYLAQSTLYLEQGAVQSCPATYFSFSPLPTRREGTTKQCFASSLFASQPEENNQIGNHHEVLEIAVSGKQLVWT